MERKWKNFLCKFRDFTLTPQGVLIHPEREIELSWEFFDQLKKEVTNVLIEKKEMNAITRLN
jgi:hypothetical protein